jgi:hypothetical protein
MTASGSLESSPCGVSYPLGRPHKDVSGSQEVAMIFAFNPDSFSQSAAPELLDI